jgi:glutamine synthetase
VLGPAVWLTAAVPDPLTVEELRTLVEAGGIDTVLVAFTDMQGRLQGKRCHAQHFLDEVLTHATEACNYLLAVDVEMNTVAGYAMSSWDTGYGDFVLRPDLSTLRLVPWQPGTALVLSDVQWHDGSPVVASPRQILRRQVERLAERGLVAFAGTELEFIVFQDTYEAAWTAGYHGLTPGNQYNVDYSLLGTARVEPLLRRIRNDMTGAGLLVESAKGECNPGQHEIAFLYAEALVTADRHSIYKTGAKEIAAQEGMSLTFMSKYNEREGNSCHIHLSVRSTDGVPVMAGDGTGDASGFSPLMEHWLAGQLACLEELTLLFAPNVNSYKRFAEGSFAPTAIAWGRDNRTCAMRVVGHGPALRVENRVPGGDVNPYLALAGLIAAGLHGIDEGLVLEPPLAGNAYVSNRPRVPATLRDATDRFTASEVARAAFGHDVVEHYTHAARVEQAAFDAAVTDWERVRGFERL